MGRGTKLRERDSGLKADDQGGAHQGERSRWGVGTGALTATASGGQSEPVGETHQDIDLVIRGRERAAKEPFPPMDGQAGQPSSV